MEVKVRANSTVIRIKKRGSGLEMHYHFPHALDILKCKGETRQAGKGLSNYTHAKDMFRVRRQVQRQVFLLFKNTNAYTTR